MWRSVVDEAAAAPHIPAMAEKPAVTIAREAREAAALRANLQRRKEQMRARAAEAVPALDEKIDSMGE